MSWKVEQYGKLEAILLTNETKLFRNLINIRPVDLDHLNEFSDNEVIQVVREEAGDDSI